MAITAIILSMILMLISGASHSFRRTNDEVNLQMEAQVAINQLSTLAMEAKDIGDNSDPSSEDTKYIIQNIDGTFYGVVFIKSDKKLYLINPLLSASDLDAADKYNLLAEYVSTFKITLAGKNATIDILFALGDEEYPVNRKVKIRNK